MWSCPCGVENPDSRRQCRGCGVSKEKAERVAAGLDPGAVFLPKSPQERGRARAIAGTVVAAIGLAFLYWASHYSPYSPRPFLRGGWVFKEGFYQGLVVTLLALVGVGAVLIVKGFFDMQVKQGGPPQVSAARICPHCSAPVAAGMKFCAQCGQSVVAPVCRQCSTPLSSGEKFCTNCGTAVA